MKDDTIAVLKPGTKVCASRPNDKRGLLYIGTISVVSVFNDGTTEYELVDPDGDPLTSVVTPAWQVEPAPEPVWIAEQHEGTWRVRRRSTLRPLIEDRVTFVDKGLVQRETWASLRGRAVIAVRDKQAAAEKMAAFLNELEAE